MSIVTNGWGGSAISIFGWGSEYIEEYVASIIAAYLASSSAYSCVPNRRKIVVQDRRKIVVQDRSSGWPRESGEICE